MLDYAGVEAGDIVGNVPERSREVTAEKAAINSVMAGCRPEYFPVVLAGYRPCSTLDSAATPW